MNKSMETFLRTVLVIFLLLWQFPALATPKKLYWFIPDGMRADRGDFNIYEWAKRGKLPAVKKMMEEGAYGYSIPDFPSHTPTNFASLLTGTTPDVHGISDGPMHVEGFPLERPSAMGFSSLSKKVPPIWVYMEEKYNTKSVLASIPGSTPPQLKKGVTIRGRWGGWGADFHSVIFEPESKLKTRKSEGRGFKLFFLGQPLTQFVPTTKGEHWESEKKDVILTELKSQGISLFAAIKPASSKGKSKKAASIDFSFDKKNTFTTLKQGSWSPWFPMEIDYKGAKLKTDIKLKVIKLWANGDFRIRLLINNNNTFIVDPPFVAEKIQEKIGPMVDFADNWPHQLLQEFEDKQTFLDEAAFSWNWHRDLVPVVVNEFKPDVFIHDIYTPNLMLESRWWYDAIHSKAKKAAASEWKDIESLYQGIDNILAETLKAADEDTLVVLSSDHGVCHLKRLVKLNNFFAKKGWLKFTIDPRTGEPTIDWKNTQVVYLKMMNIYINPNGLAGNWTRGSGPEYLKLRKEVVDALKSLKDENGKNPLQDYSFWENSIEKFGLPKDRVGDIILEAKLNYFWHEEVDETKQIFVKPKTTGYKQSIDPVANECCGLPLLFGGKT